MASPRGVNDVVSVGKLISLNAFALKRNFFYFKMKTIHPVTEIFSVAAQMWPSRMSKNGIPQNLTIDVRSSFNTSMIFPPCIGLKTRKTTFYFIGAKVTFSWDTFMTLKTFITSKATSRKHIFFLTNMFSRMDHKLKRPYCTDCIL